MIEIPLKPLSVNRAFRGRHFKTGECKQYEEDLWILLPKRKIIEGKVKIEYTFFLKNHKMSDLDNQIKVLQDILVKKGYIEDDRKIYCMVVKKIAAKEDKIQIEITPYEEDDN